MAATEPGRAPGSCLPKSETSDQSTFELVTRSFFPLTKSKPKRSQCALACEGSRPDGQAVLPVDLLRGSEFHEWHRLGG